jgi:hypothetical protein
MDFIQKQEEKKGKELGHQKKHQECVNAPGK